MTLDIKDRLYTSSEVAEILGVSLRSVYRYLEEGKLDADIKTATGRHRFSKKNILDFLQPSQSSQNTTSEKKIDAYQDNKGLANSDTQKFSPVDTIEDDFDFDNFFESDIVKKSPEPEKNFVSPASNSFSSISSDKEDEDLEKLFEELEKEFASNSVNSSNSPVVESQVSQLSSKPVSKLAEDDFDFDFDFLDKNEDLSDYLNINKASEPQEKSSLKKAEDDFDFDFDFFDQSANDIKESSSTTVNNQPLEKNKSKEEDEDDFFNLDDIFSELDSEKELNTKTQVREQEDAVENDTDSDSWLNRFRKASEKSNIRQEEIVEKKYDKDSDDFDLSDFFTSQETTSSISSLSDEYSKTTKPEEIRNDFSRSNRKKDYYYLSSLSGLKEIAQTVDKVSRKFDLDYAFTLNAGLSLYKGDISPFSVIHVYINERDLEIFEDYLKLTPSSEKDAQLCLKIAHDREIFQDSLEMQGLFVVSKVQLRSDFIDSGLDNLAREI